MHPRRRKRFKSVHWTYESGTLRFLLNEDDGSVDASFQIASTGAEFTDTFGKDVVAQLYPAFQRPTKPKLQLRKNQIVATWPECALGATISLSIPRKQHEGTFSFFFN